jgi:hypothetical protein
MSFWKTFGFHTVSAIDMLLDGEDYNLEQLLDEEEILQETKAQNKKLIDLYHFNSLILFLQSLRSVSSIGSLVLKREIFLLFKFEK